MSNDADETWRSVRAPVQDVPALQRPGQSEVLRKVRFPDDDSRHQDRRVYLDVAQLQKLVDVATSSPMLRVVMHGVQVELEQRRDASGHVYEVWVLCCTALVPEGTGAEATVLARKGASIHPLIRRS